MSNLDDEELEATRKLNGVAKKSNIEKDIMSEEAFNELIDNFEVVETLTEYGRKAIKQNVKKLQTRIKELEEENYVQKVALLENSIPKQKVKNKIEEAKDNKKVGNTAYEYTEEDVWDIVKDELEELLEDK